MAPRPRFDLVRSLGVEPEIGYTGQDFAATIRPRHSCSNLQQRSPVARRPTMLVSGEKHLDLATMAATSRAAR